MNATNFTKGQTIHGIRCGIFSVVKTESTNCEGIGCPVIVTVCEVHPTTGVIGRRKMRFPGDMFREWNAG